MANGGTGELRWFSPEGTPVRTWAAGRAGAEQPVSAFASLYHPADTLVAWDARARVLTRFSSRGELLRQDTLRMADTTRRFAILGVFGDGGVLVEAGVPRLTYARISRASSAPVRDSSTSRGAPADSLGVAPGDELFLSHRGRQRHVLTAFRSGSVRARVLVLPRGISRAKGIDCSSRLSVMTPRAGCFRCFGGAAAGYR